jgi:hypothetical protein
MIRSQVGQVGQVEQVEQGRRVEQAGQVGGEVGGEVGGVGHVEQAGRVQEELRL